MKRTAFLLACAALVCSCGEQSYRQPAFGGMKGRVQEVTVYHIMPEGWRTDTIGSGLMYMNASAYDIEGNEICSALLDSTGHIQSQAESLFENGVCVRSTQKAGNRTIATLDLVSKDKNTLTYNKKVQGKASVMKVAEKRRGRKYTSTVTEDGKVTTVSVITTDAENQPISVSTTDEQGKEILEINTYKDGNIVEKHIKKVGTTLESVIYTQYTVFDAQGNWTEARTYNKIHMAEEIIRREIKYWP